MPGAAQKPTIAPVTLWQRYLLNQDADPECRDDLRAYWVLPQATLVRPGVDYRRLRRAMEKLRARHDSLRLRFDRIRGQWRGVFDPPGPVDIERIDLGEVDDATFEARIKQIANAPMPLVGHPLVEMLVVGCGRRGDVIVTRVHHAITDGHGMVVVTEDLLKFMIGLPITTRAVSHTEYIARFQDPPPSRAAEIEAFWRRLHSDFTPAPNIGRKAKGFDPLWRAVGDFEARRLSVSTSGESFARLEAMAGGLNVGSATALFAGYLEALCQSYDIDRLMFVTHVGRTDPALDGYMGDHTLDPLLPYRTAGTAKLGASTQALGETLMQAIAHLPSEAARRGTPWEDEIIARGGFPGQFSAYQPRALTRQDRSMFREGLSASHGVEHSFGPYTLMSLDVSMFGRGLSDLQFDLGPDGGRSGFEMHYDGKSFFEKEMKTLAERILDLLDLEPEGMVSI